MKYQSVIAFRNVKKNWRHSMAALLSVTAAFFSVVLFQGYMTRVEQLYLESYKYRAMYGDVIIENKDLRSPEGKSAPWNFLVTKEQQDAVLSFVGRHPEVKNYVRFLALSGLITNGKTSVIFTGYGYDVDTGMQVRGDLWRWNTLYGYPLGINENGYDPKESLDGQALLGQGLARTLGCLPDPDQKIYDRSGYYIPAKRTFSCNNSSIQISGTTASGQLNALDLNVHAIVDAGYAELDPRWIILPMQTAQQFYNTDQVTYMSLLLQDGEDPTKLIKAFDEEVGSKFPQLKIQRWQDHIFGDLYLRTMDLMRIFRNFVVVIIVSISTLSVFNTMMKIILERTREIGTLQSLGFKKSMVRQIFVLESIYLTLAGCIVGAIFSAVASILVSQAGFMYKAGLLSEPIVFKILIDPKTYAFSFVLLLLISSLTTAFVARNILKKKIIDCLNYA